MTLFTADTDWACEEVIADTISLFEKHKIKCTFFATHKSSSLLSANKDFFEIGIHPNFNEILKGNGGSAEKILDDILKIYPDALGVRSHSLTQSGYLLSLFAQKKLTYDVNHFMPYYSNLYAFEMWNGMLRIPFNWEDDYHFALGNSFENSGIRNSRGLNVFNFHPIHVFLNSENNDRYLKVKHCLDNPKEIIRHRNTSDVPGTRDLLEKLLYEASNSAQPQLTVGEYSKKLKNEKNH